MLINKTQSKTYQEMQQPQLNIIPDQSLNFSLSLQKQKQKFKEKDQGLASSQSQNSNQQQFYMQQENILKNKQQTEQECQSGKPKQKQSDSFTIPQVYHFLKPVKNDKKIFRKLVPAKKQIISTPLKNALQTTIPEAESNTNVGSVFRRTNDRYSSEKKGALNSSQTQQFRNTLQDFGQKRSWRAFSTQRSKRNHSVSNTPKSNNFCFNKDFKRRSRSIKKTRKSVYGSEVDEVFEKQPELNQKRKIVFLKTFVVSIFQSVMIEISILQRKCLIVVNVMGEEKKTYKLILSKDQMVRIHKESQQNWQNVGRRVFIQRSDKGQRIRLRKKGQDGAIIEMKKYRTIASQQKRAIKKQMEKQNFRIQKYFVERNYYQLIARSKQSKNASLNNEYADKDKKSLEQIKQWIDRLSRPKQGQNWTKQKQIHTKKQPLNQEQISKLKQRQQIMVQKLSKPRRIQTDSTGNKAQFPKEKANQERNNIRKSRQKVKNAFNPNAKQIRKEYVEHNKQAKGENNKQAQGKEEQVVKKANGQITKQRNTSILRKESVQSHLQENLPPKGVTEQKEMTEDKRKSTQQLLYEDEQSGDSYQKDFQNSGLPHQQNQSQQDQYPNEFEQLETNGPRETYKPDFESNTVEKLSQSYELYGSQDFYRQEPQQQACKQSNHKLKSEQDYLDEQFD